MVLWCWKVASRRAWSRGRTCWRSSRAGNDRAPLWRTAGRGVPVHDGPHPLACARARDKKVLVKGVQAHMSAPQPPNQPGGGEQQPPQGPPSGSQPAQDGPFESAEPTQVVQPGQPDQGGQQQPTDQPADPGGEATQVVQPGQAPQQPADPGGEATQVVQPAQPGQQPQQQGPGAESTQLVPPDQQPQASIPYAPPPSAADNPGAVNPQGYGAPQGQQ